MQKQRGAANVFGVIGLRDQADARPGAALDLMEHARPRTIGEDGVLAGSELKDFLQQRHAFPNRAGAWKRTEISMLAVERAAVETELRKGVARKTNVGITLVVAIQNVVTRLERLDQVRLEQQRLAFGADRGCLDARDLRDHRCDPRLVP